MMNGAKPRFPEDPSWGRRAVLAGCGVIAALFADPLWARAGDAAGDDATDGERPFSIPAQPLADALGTYGEVTHVQMLVDGGLTAGRRSNAVYGRFTPADALRWLLAGTGLDARPLGAVGFTLEPVRNAASAPAAPMPPLAASAAGPLDGYSARIRRALHETLCRNRETLPGTFRALVRLWIGESGRVGRWEIVSPSGDGQRDSLLAAELQSFAVDEPPPPGLRQPVTLLLVSEGAGTAGGCLLSGMERASTAGTTGDKP